MYIQNAFHDEQWNPQIIYGESENETLVASKRKRIAGTFLADSRKLIKAQFAYMKVSEFQHGNVIFDSIE